jgi:hypothetical protein
VAEADRVLVYLGVFVAAFLVAQTDQRRQRFGEGIGIAVAGVVLLALTSRLLPHVFSLSAEDTSGSRLFYPLHYWNADGFFCAIATPLLLWLSRRSLVGILRPLAAATIPAIVLALYLTASRGGILVLVIAAACLLAMSADRLWMLATVMVGAVLALPAIFYVHSHSSIGSFIDDGSLVGQGLVTLLLILAGSAVAGGVFLLQRRAERGRGATVTRALAISRDPRVLRGIGIASLVLLVVLGIAFGARAWDKFSSADLGVSAEGGAHLGEVTSGGRVQFWEVALESFGEKPLAGHGAGTYQFAWNQDRPVAMTVHNAHSLYLQALSELGIVGAILVLALVLFLLGVGVAAWRAASGRQRELYAVLTSVSLAFALGCTFDWFWQIAGVGVVFFLCTGVLVAARCGQVWSGESVADSRRRSRATIAGLAVAWLSMLALIGPLLVNYELNKSNDSIAAGNVDNAIAHADTARSIEPWAASPYRQLGLLAEVNGEYGEAIHRFDQAISREEENWALWFDRARAEYRAGDETSATTDLAEAKRLNPLEACLAEGFEGC